MEQTYAISETTLTALGDAVRNHVGATKIVQIGVEEQEMVKISKTSNAISFTERSGGYGNYQASYDVVSIPGASKIVVDIAYQTESVSYDWVQIAVGSVSSAPSTSTYPKYGGQSLTRKELIFENTDTITFYFKTDSSTDAYLGYYAECRGYDEEGNIIKDLLPIYEEVPNTMTVNTMIEKINGLFPCEFWWNFNTATTKGYTASLDVSNYSTLTFFYDIATSAGTYTSAWTLQAYKGYEMGVSSTNKNVAQPIKVDSNGIVEDILSDYKKTENGRAVIIDVSDYNYITFYASNTYINSTAYYGFLHLYNFSAEQKI